MRVDSVSFFNPDARKVFEHPCPECGSEMLYEHHFVGKELVYDNTLLECPECGHEEQVKQ
ncbi:MAG TPA: hypothetical protein VGB78_09235 [Thermoplasmata archaeon]